MIARYETLNEVLHAYETGSYDRGIVPGVIEQLLVDLAQTMTQSLCIKAYEALEMGSTAALMRYLQREMTPRLQESFRVLFLDAHNRLLGDRVLWTGSINTVQIHPREVVRGAIELNASALIVAHNHPHASARPSKEDIDVTQRLELACAAVDVIVHDHLIVGDDGVFSMRAEGCMSDSVMGKRSNQRRETHV